ncbi:MAG: DUF1398 family protein [Bacteriovoracaceae bacterium]|nr:DUF1398 family protein [Bacteriovoracaceae bacterium]
MTKAIDNLMTAIAHGMKIRPKVGGFPYLAETLYQAGVTKNTWSLPSCQSVYVTKLGPVVMQGTPLITGTSDIAPFDREALIHALRNDQAGKSTFPEFLAATWNAGVVGYEVDFTKRVVVYYGCQGEEYLEEYPEVRI